MNEPRPTIRLDKWLWQARFFKTRTIAAKAVSAGHMQVNDKKVSKAATLVKIDDRLIFPQAKILRIVSIVNLGTRRGPAPEAQALYADHTPEPEPKPPEIERKGRPTKRDRRAIDKIKRAGP